MSLLIFELVFAAIALGLLVVMGMIVRELWQKRRAKRLADHAEAGPAPARAFGLKQPRQSAEPEPGFPPAPRKRQLRSLSDAAQSEVTAADQRMTVAPAVEVPAVEVRVTEVPTEDHAIAGDYDKAVLAWLEAEFERFQAGEITLDAYKAELTAERSAIDRRIASARAGGASDELEQALAAAESVRWCLDWATKQGRSEDS